MMSTKIKIGQNSKVNIKWNVLPLDYSRDGEANIIAKMSQKYGIPKDNIKVEACFINKNKDGQDTSFGSEIVSNINDPIFQRNLFKQYLNEKDIKDYDFNKIVEIDNLINTYIDYDKYDKNKHYSIKWIKWSNFMSYGSDNFVDFNDLKGLVLLTSDPANQGGKTTFCLDLIRFFLFGKVTSRESDWTLSKVFNKHLPEATEVTVEGCICIDGVDYVIKRVVSRPALNKRTEKSKVSQKVNYYKIVNNEYIDLADDENIEQQEEATTTQTNKAIKEAIGNERDFDLMICVNSDNLKGLISLKDTERGRLLMRWIGLLPLEEKDKNAREYFNKTFMPKLLLNKYNRIELECHNEAIKEDIEENKKNITKYDATVKDSEKKIEKFNIERDNLLQSKQQIDKTLLDVDVITLETVMKRLIEQGNIKKAEKEENEAKLKTFGEIDFNENVYRDVIETEKNISIELNTTRLQCNQLKNDIEALKKGEFCPTCGAKLKNVDNSAKIKEKENLYNELVQSGIKKKEILEQLFSKKALLEIQRSQYNEKIKLELQISKNEVDLNHLRTEYKEKAQLKKDIDANKTAIENNNKIDVALNLVNENIKSETNILNNARNGIAECNKAITIAQKTLEEDTQKIALIIEEEKDLRNWKIYLDLIGKNGISKLVLKNTLPIINGELSQILNGVCDFTVEVAIDDHQDVEFYLVHDGIKSNLASGSGFEQTVASLALRSVLSKISSFSKPSFVVFDEILGGVSDENYDNVKQLYNKIVGDYQFIFQISHLKAIADWHSMNILISKKNNISTISKL